MPTPYDVVLPHTAIETLAVMPPDKAHAVLLRLGALARAAANPTAFNLDRTATEVGGVTLVFEIDDDHRRVVLLDPAQVPPIAKAS